MAVAWPGPRRRAMSREPGESSVPHSRARHTESTALGASLMAFFLGACAVGPQHTVPQVVPASARVGVSTSTDSEVFDSLARAATMPPPLAPCARVEAPGDYSVGWL